MAHQAGAEVYPSIGGWNLSDPSPVMAADAEIRATFAMLFPFEEGCRVGYFLSTYMWLFFVLVYPFWSWIASSTIDDHLFLTSRLTALYIGFPFLKSSSSCRLGLKSTLFVSLSHYYNLEDTLSLPVI